MRSVPRLLIAVFVTTLVAGAIAGREDAVRVWLADESISTSRRIQFKTGFTQLTPASLGVVEQVARLIKRSIPEDRIVVVESHTDANGAEATNLVLSQARAVEVVRLLVGLGVPAERLRAVGMGSSRPLVPHASREAWRNRRVEFRLEARASSPALVATVAPVTAPPPRARIQLLEDEPPAVPAPIRIGIALLGDDDVAEDLAPVRFAAISPRSRPRVALLDDSSDDDGLLAPSFAAPRVDLLD